ncbi:MAG: MarR family transcriptional regulator [Elusimicrobia bacterium]|nr:MarR family transcriptional regulator [Elusimicrobiota bacterium]
MAKEFSRRLAAARREAGFKSAYQFYHGNGGRRHFPFTYVHYLRIENAGKLPRPQWLGRLLTGLRLSPGEAGCRRLFLAYLKDLLGGPEASALILEPLLCRHGAASAPAGAEAVRWMKAEHSVHLTPAQFKALASSESAYWCSELLCNDGGSWTAEELAEALGITAAAAQAGLARLKTAGLARRTAAGRYRARWTGKLFTFPGRLEGMGRHLDLIQRYWERMASRRGERVSARVEVVRAEAGFMRRYSQTLAETLDAANAGAAQTKGEDTGLYLIEAGIRRLLPF